MTLREITDAAIRLVCENPQDVSTEDYRERASYILPAFCGQCAASDDRYRLAHSMSTKVAVSAAYMELDELFPLADVFVAPATYYLAAMLVVDENEDLSDRFFALSTDALASVEATLPATSKAVSDRYGLL